MTHFVKTIFGRCLMPLLFSAVMIVTAPFSAHAALVKVGDTYGAGMVVYILQPGDPGYKPNEQHGLVAARQDLPEESLTWSEAKTATAMLEISGHKGWSLPTREELIKLYQSQAVVGGFRDYSYYWSASEVDQHKVWALDFYNGEQVVSIKSGALSGIRRIRPVQHF